MQKPLLNRIVFVLSFVGLLIAGSLWHWHNHPADIPCGISGGCEIVANSPYSRFPVGYGPPVAMYGALGYGMIIVLTFLRTLAQTPKYDRALLSLVVLGALFGTLVSGYLTFMELNPNYIGAICRWCMGSQILIVTILAIALGERIVYRSDADVRPGAVS